MKQKLITYAEVAPHLCHGMTIMFGGFMGIGTPARLVRALLEKEVGDLTLIGNDTAFIDTGVGPLIAKRRVKKVIASHIGTNPETGRQMLAGETDVELVPQGTLIEQIRCGGAGLGGVLTPTGVGDCRFRRARYYGVLCDRAAFFWCRFCRRVSFILMVRP